MTTRSALLLSLALVAGLPPGPAAAQKSRVIVLTDIENEPDDAMSMVRFLTYANQWEVEGLVATTSVHQKDKTAAWRIVEIVEAYGKVRDNLERHEPGYPTAAHLLCKGPLGAQHPHTTFLMEGDTPSFLHLVGNGLGDPEHPDWGSWGGRYELYMPRTRKWFYEPETRPFWSDAEDEVLGVDGHWHTSNKATIWRWRAAYQHDFAARMDWTIKPYAEANHTPVARLGHPDRLTVRSGERVTLSAKSSSDRDGTAMSVSTSRRRCSATFVPPAALTARKRRSAPNGRGA